MADLAIDTGEVRLAAEESGTGTPIVLLHGLTATRRYVVMGSGALKRSGHRVIAYDARGHGRSSPAPEPGAYTYEELVADLEAVLDELALERAVLAGASMGAHTLLALALRRPERVGGLVVITPAYEPATNDDPARLARWDALSDGLRSGGVDGFLRAYGEPRVPEAWRESVVKVIRQRLALHEHPDAVADALRAVPRSRPFGELSQLGAISRADSGRRIGRRSRPRAPAARGGGIRRRDPGGAPGHRRARPLAGGLAGQSVVEGDRRGRVAGAGRLTSLLSERHVLDPRVRGGQVAVSSEVDNDP